MNALAILYTFGRGVATQDFLQAHVYFNLAAAHRKTEDKRKASAEERDKLFAHLTERQKEKSQEVVSSWQPKPEPARELVMGPAVTRPVAVAKAKIEAVAKAITEEG
jgi:hypothetical protein